MNRSLVYGGIGVLVVALIIGLFLYFQIPSPDAPPEQVSAPQVESDAPAASEPREDGQLGVPEFDIVRVDEDGDVVIAGRAKPGCTIVVRDGDTEVGRTTVDRGGEWVLVPDTPLPGGERQLTLSAECEGEEPVEADRVVAVFVPERDSGKTGALAVSVPREGEGETQVLQTPRSPRTYSGLVEGGESEDASIRVGKAEYDDTGSASVSGKAEPGAKLRVYLDNEAAGDVTADENGDWTLKLDHKVAPGEYTLRVDQIDPAGKVLARVEVPFVRGEPLRDFPEGRIVVIEPGDHLWKIARERYGKGVSYAVIYEANRNQIRNPDLIFPGQVFRLPDLD